MNLELALIILDPEIQPRESMDRGTIEQYADDMLSGVQFPPVVVYFDGDDYWLSQGFHRCMSAERCGLTTINAEVREGTRQDALWDAAGSNREHDASGVRRSNADKRRAVKMALEAKPDWSNRRIAEHVGVHHELVATCRSRIQVDESSTSARRVGADGKSYPASNGHFAEPLVRPTAEADWSGSTLQRGVESESRCEPLTGQRELPFTRRDEPDHRVSGFTRESGRPMATARPLGAGEVRFPVVEGQAKGTRGWEATIGEIGGMFIFVRENGGFPGSVHGWSNSQRQWLLSNLRHYYATIESNVPTWIRLLEESL